MLNFMKGFYLIEQYDIHQAYGHYPRIRSLSHMIQQGLCWLRNFYRNYADF